MAGITCGTSTATNVWRIWATTAATTATCGAWECWTNGTYADSTNCYTSSTTATTVWRVWANQQTWVRCHVYDYAAPPTPELTPEQKKAAAAQAERQRIENDRIRAENARLAAIEAERQRIAAERADELLREHLDHQQRDELEKAKRFHVVSQKGKRFRIDRGSHGNVFELDDKERPSRRFCIQPPGVPHGDAMLAQKLLLETDEDAFRRIANVTELQPR